MKGDHWDLKVHINGQHTFVLHQKNLCAFSGKLRRMVRAKKEKKKKKKRSQTGCTVLKITDFPGGPGGFELVARFCYNQGTIAMDPLNVAVLRCCAAFLEMTDEHATGNLLSQTERYLDGLFYWEWKDIVSSLGSCGGFLSSTESSGLLKRLISPIILKISGNSDAPHDGSTPMASSSSSASSPETSSAFRFSSSSTKNCLTKEWWFEDLTVLHPAIIEHIMKGLSSYGEDNKSLVLTRFLLHYLRTGLHRKGEEEVGITHGGLADTAVHGVAWFGGRVFSCRMLFWVRRVVGGLGLSRECRGKLEMLMGSVLDEASLDELLVCGEGAVYDVNLVVRLVGVFISGGEEGVPLHRARKVARLVDKYLREVSPDPGLTAEKFVELAAILPDSARQCYDGVYRALEIYLESHPKLSLNDRSRLCRCLNFEKLTLDACKDLAKNPWIPPREAVQALISQQSELALSNAFESSASSNSSRISQSCRGPKEGSMASTSPSSLSNEKEGMIFSMRRMPGKVVRLDNVWRLIRGQAPEYKILLNNPSQIGNKAIPRLC